MGRLADFPCPTGSPSPICAENSQSRELNGNRLNKMFEFILVDDSNPERRRKNRSIAHFHVKKADQRTKRNQQTKTRESAKKPALLVVEVRTGQDDHEELWSSHARSLRVSSIDSFDLQTPSFSGGDFLAGLDDSSGWISTLSSMSPTIDLGFSLSLSDCFGVHDARTHQMVDHCRTFVFAGSTLKTLITDNA